MEASKVSFADISFRAFQQAKGVKTAAASWRGAPVEFLLSHEEFFLAPFGASAYEKPDATRLNLEVEITNSPLLQIMQEAEQDITKKSARRWCLRRHLRRRRQKLQEFNLLQRKVFAVPPPLQDQHRWAPCLSHLRSA